MAKCRPGCTCGRHVPYPRLPAEERFWAKVDRTDTCWLWTGAVGSKGYGAISVDGHLVKAHRFAYELLVGPIPVNLQLDHRVTCPKNCVNPDHLRLATNKQNCENLSGAYANSRSGVRGVSWDRDSGKWKVQVYHHGRAHSRRVDDLEDARAAAIALRNQLFTHNDIDRVTT